ncbi:MAG: M23 family metallopeptidase [Romboutsia sp.]
MKKYIKIIILSLTLVFNFFIYENHNTKIYALEDVNKIDLLILNKSSQQDIQSKLEILNAQIESAKENLEKENSTYSSKNLDVEVVNISFVDENKSEKDNVATSNLYEKNIVNTELTSIEEEKNKLEDELEKYIIEGVKLEKSIEEEKKEYMVANKVSYIKGCWPVPSYTEISSPFGERMHPITNKVDFHSGIDIPAPQNTEIVSSDDGIVIFSGTQNGYGNVVKIKHFDGKVTVYAHNNSNIVGEGDIVKQGQPIAEIGSTGDSTGNHVHFETKISGENINPINIVIK